MEQLLKSVEDVEMVYVDTDFLIIGAGNAGCFAL